jgi:ribosomal protein L11 methyltransferase
VTVAPGDAEAARALVLEVFPEGFEEVELGDIVELAGYGDEEQERLLSRRFRAVRAAEVEAGWDERWRAFHVPAVVGPLWIGPPWEEPEAGKTAVVIDPGRAFGTGAHATTRLCLELLSGLPRGSALDVGCGSGVLAIAAAKLGFEPVLAVDTDEAALEATELNAAANGVSVDARRADARSEYLRATDVALVNVALDVVVEVARRVEATYLVTSGYLRDDRPAPGRFDHVQRRTDDGWAADLFERR